MGDFLKVLALLGLGGMGLGAFGEFNPGALRGTPLEGVANNMQSAVHYIKNDAVKDVHNLLETVNNARK
jgi:hypothetical protein